MSQAAVKQDDLSRALRGPAPRLTDEHLRALHRVLYSLGWEPERFLRERREVREALDRYFADDRAHLGGPSR